MAIFILIKCGTMTSVNTIPTREYQVTDALNKAIGYTTKMTQIKSYEEWCCIKLVKQCCPLFWMHLSPLFGWCEAMYNLWPLLLTWFNFNPSIKSYEEWCCIKLVKQCCPLFWMHLSPLFGWCEAMYNLWPLLLTWFNFNPSMDK